MIIKEREIPIKIPILQALVRRINPKHPKLKMIEEELAKRVSGYKGEVSLDYYFSFLDEDEYYIFHSLRLPYKNYFFQMDSLIICRYFILIIEVKNLSGVITLDPRFQQLVRTYNGKEAVLPDPVQQVKLQQYQLQSILKTITFPQVPIESIVVFTHQEANLKTNTDYPLYFDKVVRSTKLLDKIEQYTFINKDVRLTKSDINSLSNYLLQHHSPENFDALSFFNITESELSPGVHCPKCYTLAMERKWGKWVCGKCSFASKDAYIQSIDDYQLLLRPTINNQQLRNFLGITSPILANKILTSMNLPFSGNTKDREYFLTF